MEIKNYVKVYNSALPLNVLSNFMRFINYIKFEDAKILSEDGTAITNYQIRKTQNYCLDNKHNSLTNVHWKNILNFYFSMGLNKYKQDNKILDFEFNQITNIDILKYENTGFYTWHTDHAASIPRTMSCILLLNNDYEGGNICFRNPDGSGEWSVDVVPNRMIIWPSNFLYPHTVKPVTKGIRYSVVAWAL